MPETGAIRRRHIAEEWDSFARSVLPKGCSDIQRREMRVAFYGGVSAIIGKLMRLFEDGSDEPTEADLEVMSSVMLELQDFKNELKAASRP